MDGAERINVGMRNLSIILIAIVVSGSILSCDKLSDEIPDQPINPTVYDSLAGYWQLDFALQENGDTIALHAYSGYFYFKDENKFDGVLSLPGTLLEFDNWDYVVVGRQIVIPFVDDPFIFGIDSLGLNFMHLRYHRDVNGELSVFPLYYAKN